MKCRKCKCKKNKTIDFEDVGLGMYCQKCLDEEDKIWQKEAGWNKSGVF